jgi:hypothetical protein
LTTRAQAKKETLYLSGPMRGFENYNYPVFNTLAEQLRDAGFTVHNPAENFPNEEPGTRTYSEYMRLDIASVLNSTGIVLMPGWERSEGAKFEATTARLIGLKFYLARLDETHTWFLEAIDAPKNIVDSDGIEAIARALVYGDRNETYGPPGHDFECTGRKWAATLSAHTGTHIPDIPPVIVAIMMTDLKMSRMASNPEHLDSRVDGIGYILCADRIITDKL